VELRILSAGAVEAILREMAPGFETESGARLAISYAPAGRVRDRACAGEPVDVAIATAAVVEQLAGRHLVRPETCTELGRVGGGIAVKKGAPRPAIGTPEALREALLAAEEIHHADPRIATAGAYFLEVADRLGIGDEARRKSRTAGGGKACMEAMARSPARALGVTQISEILAVPAVELVGPYPGDLQVMTTYAGIVLARTPHPEACRAFLRFLTRPPARACFLRSGYELPAP
jgi:molybdate transport system substrate-binding protein